MPRFISPARVIGTELLGYAQILEILGTPTSPVMFLPCVDTTGATVTDYSGKGYDWSVAGGINLEKWTTPPKYQNQVISYTFYGLPIGANWEGLTIADNDDFSFGDGLIDSPFSVGIWVYITLVTLNPVFIYKYGFAGLNKKEWRFGLQTNRQPWFVLHDDSVGSYIGRSYTTALGYGSWNLLVGTYDGSSSSVGIKIYLNGLHVDNSNINSGVYIAMENTTQAPTCGWCDIGGLASGIFGGSIWGPFVTAKELSAYEVWKLNIIGKGLLGI